MTETVITPTVLPVGQITAWPEYGDDDDDWIVGVRTSAYSWIQIAVCPNKRLARWLAAHLDKIKERGP